MKNYWTFVVDNRKVLLFGFICVFWGNLGQSFFIGWYGEPIKQSLNLSAKAYGGFYAAATLLSAFALAWLGPWLDKVSLKKVLAFACLGLTFACVGFSLSFNVGLLFLAFFLVRLFGQGMLPLIGHTTMVKYFEQGRGKAISLAASGVSLGEIVLPLLAIALIATLGWRHSWLVFAASVPLVLAPLCVWLMRNRTWTAELEQARIDESQASSTENQGVNGRRLLFSDKRYWFCLPTQLSVPFILTAVFIHQDYILIEKQWSAAALASGFVLYGVSHWLSSIAFGVLVDRFSGTFLFRFYTLPLIVAMGVLAGFDGTWGLALFMLLLGMSIGGSGPVCGSMWAEAYGKSVQGAIRSSSGAVVILSTAVAPIAVGWLIDVEVGLQAMFAGFTLFFLLSLCLLRFSYRPK